jgi:outer membrane protein
VPRSPSWAVGAVARINLFRGFGDQARLAEAKAGLDQQALERQKAETAARVEVRVATARLTASRAAEAVGREAAAQAREQQRIIRDRYDQGLSDATSLLRAAEAVMAADAQQTSAQVDALVATAALTRALGRP